MNQSVDKTAEDIPGCYQFNFSVILFTVSCIFCGNRWAYTIVVFTSACPSS